MNRQAEIAKKHKSQPDPMENKLPWTIRDVATATRAVDEMSEQPQDEGAAALESNYKGLASDSDSILRVWRRLQHIYNLSTPLFTAIQTGNKRLQHIYNLSTPLFNAIQTGNKRLPHIYNLSTPLFTAIQTGNKRLPHIYNLSTPLFTAIQTGNKSQMNSQYFYYNISLFKYS